MSSKRAVARLVLSHLQNAREDRYAKMEEAVFVESVSRIVGFDLASALKDKDLMSDTGGISKGRLREPDHKPSREDRKKRYRTRRKQKSDQDEDTDQDEDLKLSSERSLIMAADDKEQDAAGKALNNVDAAADLLVASLTTFEENLNAVRAEGPEQQKALSTMKDLLDTALNPYAMDFLKALDAFE